MQIIPSQTAAGAERQARRENWKSGVRGAAPEIALTDEIADRLQTKAAAYLRNGAVSVKENTFYIRAGRAKFHIVYKINDIFRCECREQETYGECSHQIAAAEFAARQSRLVVAFDNTARILDFYPRVEKPFIAQLEITDGGRAQVLASAFQTEAAARLWLISEGFKHLTKSGSISTGSGAVFILDGEILADYAAGEAFARQENEDFYNAADRWSEAA